jgi:hypothetical protein
LAHSVQTVGLFVYLVVLISGCTAKESSSLAEAQAALRSFDFDRMSGLGTGRDHLMPIAGNKVLTCVKRDKELHISFVNNYKFDHTDLVAIGPSGKMLHLEFFDRRAGPGITEKFVVENGHSEAVYDNEDGVDLTQIVWKFPGDYFFALTQPQNRWIPDYEPAKKFDPDEMTLLGFCKVEL